MAIIDLININKNYEIVKILIDINFAISEGERIGVVGKNGSGKSTLLKIVDGTLNFDSGERIIQNSVVIKTLPQNPIFPPNITVKEALELELKEINGAKAEFETINRELNKNPQNHSLIRRQGELISFIEHHNGWNLDSKLEQLLEKFNLKEFENRAVNLLSGGEQRRVSLAGLILNRPDLLLLDEPTNHLDVYMVEFLEEILLGEKFTLLFISHDRYFIDNVATKIVEIDDGKLRTFIGGYSSYLVQKEELLRVMQKEHENLLKILKAEEEWLSGGVKARLKRNEGRKNRVFELRDKAKKNPSLIRKIRLELEREQKNFNQEDGVNRRKMLFELENIFKSLGDKKLIDNFSTRILQKDRIAVVGKNGAGKSTLLKILLNELAIDKGMIKRGEFNIGYFDQHRTSLDESKNIMEIFCPNGGDRVNVGGKNMHVFGYLKNFLFPKEHLDKKIEVLSGGEKNRVALALLFTKNIDCLILDEPTNDLDIPTINILEEYLLNFEGCVIFVSHDRYFVDKVAKKLFIFRGNGEIFESFSSYSEYLDIEKELREIDEIENEKEEEPKIEKPKSKQTKLSYKEQKELETLPNEIEKLELEINELKNCLGNPECYEIRGVVSVASELEAKELKCEELVMRYLELEEKVESLKA